MRAGCRPKVERTRALGQTPGAAEAVAVAQVRRLTTQSSGEQARFRACSAHGARRLKPASPRAQMPARELSSPSGSAARIDVSFVLGAVSLAGAGAAAASFVGHSVKEGNAEVKAELSGVKAELAGVNNSVHSLDKALAVTQVQMMVGFGVLAVGVGYLVTKS